MKNKLFLSMLFLMIFAANQASDQAFPFADRPDLTWQKFEEEFRAEHPDLAIPPMTESDDTDFLAHDRKAGRIIFSADTIKQAQISSLACKAACLHELGHHFYPEEKRKANREKAKQVVPNIFPVYHQIGYAIPIANKAMMCANGCYILKHGPSAKLLCGLFMIQKSPAILKSLTGAYVDNRLEYEIIRPEEIAADQFAFERASAEALKAFDKELLSLQGSLNFQKAYYDKIFAQSELTGIYKYAMGVEMKANQLFKKISHKYSMIHDLFDPEHPCDRDRSAAIAAELKCRGQK